jgi:peptide/nickel transport system permease protein
MASSIRASRWNERLTFGVRARLGQGLRDIGGALWRDSYGRAGLCILGFYVVVAIVSPWVVPYDPWAHHLLPDGSLARLGRPSAAHWFGTTFYGHDVFTQTVLGTRLAFGVGLITAVMVGFVGTNVGLLAGYFGGRTDDALMRLTDFVYAIPFLPFTMLAVSLMGHRLDVIVGSMSVIFWRSAARVVRSQVLTLRARPYIVAARASGAGHLRIMYVHILPNVLPLGFLYVVFGVAWAVLTEASVAFIGLGDPNNVSWGHMLNKAFATGSIRFAWWWVVPPGAALMLFLVACYFLGRAFEEHVNPRLRQAR